jgi:YbbR domain-containing protein
MDRWLANTNVVRIVALVIGILLWVVVHMEEGTGGGTVSGGIREDKINEVSITPILDTSQYFISSIEPSKVSVLVKGKDSAVKKINTLNYQIQLDLTKVGEGEHILPLHAVGFPSNVDVEIIPATVKVVLEKQEKKEVPVVINVKGTPAVGLKVGKPVVKPNRVHVTLPASRLDEIDSVRGEVNVDKAQSAVTKEVKLQAFDKNGKVLNVDITPAVVEVEVPITSPFQTIPLQIRTIGEPAKGYSVASVTLDKDKVTVYGTQDTVDRMEYYQGPDIDLTGLSETKEFTLNIPLRDKVTQIEPTTVKVRVEIVPSATKALENIPITIVGQNDGFDTKVVAPETGKVNLLVEGAPAILDALKPQDVQAIVDVSNLPPGRHDVNVALNLPTFVKKGAMADLKATVEISAKPQAQAKPSASADAQAKAKNP